MCKALFHIIFIVLVAGGLALTFVSLFTDQWRQVNFNNCTAAAGNAKVENTGSMQAAGKNCIDSAQSFGVSIYGNCFKSGVGSLKNCTGWDKMPSYQKAAVAFLALGVVGGGLGLIWAVFTCCMCCCNGCLLWPLPLLAFLATVFDIVAVSVYAANVGNAALENLPTNMGKLNQQSNMGYSMWVGVGAIIAYAGATIDGIILSKVGKVMPV